MMNLPPMKIGLVGEPLTGKDTLAAYLVERHGFVHVSTADFLRFYILENNLGEPDRPLLQQVGNFLRTEHGPGYLAELAMRNDAKRLVISGMRNPHEVEVIKRGGGIIMALTLPLEVRYKRAQERGGPKDQVTFEEFKRQVGVEDINSNPNAQNMAEVLAMSDVTISNDAGREALHKRVDAVLQELAKAQRA